VEASRAWGVDVALVDGREAHRLAPFFQGDDVLAAAYCPGDVYIEEPASLIRAYLDAAQRLGVSLGTGVRVTGMTVRRGRVEGVETTAGPMAAPMVVDAAGVWARLVGHLAGAEVPVSPVRHQLSITTPIEGIEAGQPIVRIIDAAVYVRPARGGLMLGGFEAEPLAMDRLVADPWFAMSRLPLDLGVLDRLASMVERAVPVLQDAGVAEHRGGGFTMTPDGRFLVGPVPGLQGFWTATGCNGSGFSSSPAFGAVLAEWIIDGTPSLDLSVLSPQRFTGRVWSDDDLNQRGTWQYAHYYDPEASKPAAVGS
jgi:4-methylaminobutanoate oxidase (formaldehyde-forming)